MADEKQTAPQGTPQPEVSLVPMRVPEDCGKTMSHGGRAYPVDGDGIVRVPPDAVAPLERHHGFERATAPKAKK